MKKFTIALLSGVLAVLLFTLSGCADFAFNPIGRWTLTERRVYIGDRLDETKPNESYRQTALVFKKSGTGYIDGGNSVHIDFTYEYTDNEVTIRLNKNDENVPPTVYHLSDDGKALVVVLDEFDEPDDKGITQHGRLESVFVR